MKLSVLAAALVAATFFAMPVKAAVVGLQVEGGGSPIVYKLANGNFLGLWGFDNRNPKVGAVTLTSSADILSGFKGDKSRIVGFYNGPNPVNPSKPEFAPIVWNVTLPDEARLFDSLWIEWTKGELVFQGPVGGTRTMPSVATRSGSPFPEVTPVPVPATLPLFLAGLGIMGLLARRRREA